MRHEEMPRHIFALTRSEQRVVILILLALLTGTVAMHFREARSHIATFAPPTAQQSPQPATDKKATLDE